MDIGVVFYKYAKEYWIFTRYGGSLSLLNLLKKRIHEPNENSSLIFFIF